jgi:hypothetical protein
MRKIVKYYKTLIALLLLVITLAGCSDYLSIAPENDLIKEKFWTKREDVEAALAATYDAFRDVALESFIWGELRADLVTFNSTLFGNYVSIAGSNISPSNGAINYAKYYNAINLANTLMYFDDEVLKLDQSYTPRMNNAIEAEALFIRSLCYFYLVRVWKDVPLVIEPSITDKGDLFKPKSSEAEIIKQIIDDLLKAKDMAYTTEFIDNPPYYKGRANKYAIMALLSDVYLWNEQYQKSIDYADSIINSGLFGLEPTETWFSMYNPGNSMTESIFEIQFDGNYEGQASPFYNNMIPEKGSPNISFKTNIIETFFNKDDHRWCGTKTPIWKYRGVTYNGSVTRQYPQLDANVIYYRYPDMLLNKAEALNELNKVLEANEYVRLTKERANISHVNILSQTEMRNEILNERGREFIVEGKRWFDILRTAKRNNFKNKQIIINMILAGVDIKMQAILKTRVYDTLSYYLPIPEKDLLYNPNLKQNPFYDR